MIHAACSAAGVPVAASITSLVRRQKRTGLRPDGSMAAAAARQRPSADGSPTASSGSLPAAFGWGPPAPSPLSRRAKTVGWRFRPLSDAATSFGAASRPGVGGRGPAAAVLFPPPPASPLAPRRGPQCGDWLTPTPPAEPRGLPATTPTSADRLNAGNAIG